jgi:hypothetical protein
VCLEASNWTQKYSSLTDFRAKSVNRFRAIKHLSLTDTPLNLTPSHDIRSMKYTYIITETNKICLAHNTTQLRYFPLFLIEFHVMKIKLFFFWMCLVCYRLPGNLWNAINKLNVALNIILRNSISPISFTLHIDFHINFNFNTFDFSQMFMWPQCMFSLSQLVAQSSWAL